MAYYYTKSVPGNGKKKENSSHGKLMGRQI